MDVNGTNGAPTNAGRRPFVVGAIVGAVIAALVTAVLFLALDDDDSSSTTASSTTTSVTASPSPTTSSSSTTSTTRPPNLPPPQINGFGVNLQNCPEGASSTTVNVDYSTRNAEEVQFAIDDEVVQSTTELEGSADVGPLPCDGDQHRLTVTAIADGLRATRSATLAVSTNSAITVS